MYHLQHGQLYFNQARLAPFAIKPMLLFYGLSQLLKACLLVNDPSYPANSSVLAHGLSTRKRKKQGYLFLHDEVKTQRDGLYPHMLEKMFHMKQLPDKKYSMTLLLKQLPELRESFLLLKNEEVFIEGKRKGTHTFTFNASLLDRYHMTGERFEHILRESKFLHTPTVKEERQTIYIQCKNEPLHSTASPLRFHLNRQPLLHKYRSDCLYLPELALFYLILYNLSMICRYETEWWGERLHTMDCDEIPFIKQFLQLVEDQAEERILQALFENKCYL